MEKNIDDIYSKIIKKIYKNDIYGISYNNEKLELIKRELLEEYRDKGHNDIDERLQVIKEYGSFCPITDFAKAIGAGYKTIIGASIPSLFKDNISVGRTYIDNTQYNKKSLYDDRFNTYDGDSDLSWNSQYDGGAIIDNRYGMGGIRPMIESAKIFNEKMPEIKEKSFTRSIYRPTEPSKLKELNVNYKYIEYGEYPQGVASTEMISMLEKKYLKGELKETGKIYMIPELKDRYTIDSYYDIKEYTFNDKKYVRVQVTDSVTLSNKQKYNKGDYVWIEVLPVKWLLDEETHILISEYILSISDSLTSAQAYLQNYLSHDIFYIAKDLETEYEDILRQKNILAKVVAMMDSQNIHAQELKQEIAKEVDEIADTNPEKRLLLITKVLIAKIKDIKDDVSRNILYQKVEDTIKTYMTKKEKLNQARQSGKPFLTLEPESVLYSVCERQLEDLENEIVEKLNENVIQNMYNELFKDSNDKAR